MSEIKEKTVPNIPKSNPSDQTIHMVAGLDIGNGYVKGLVSTNGNAPTSIDFMSGVSLQTYHHDIKTRLSDAEELLNDLFNNMDAVFDSPTIDNTTPRLFGRRGANSTSVMEEFDVSGLQSKANQDLSSVLILGCLAGKALQEYYKKHRELPTNTLQAHCAELAVALPISEYKEYRKTYATKFVNVSHMVSIRNFETTIRVEVLIDDVQVLAEGASAQYAIVDKGPQFMEGMLADLRAHGETLPGITGNDILGAKSTLGIDIGEGTVNFPVFQNGKFNPDASRSYGRGYGSVLESALQRLRESKKNIPYASRKQLSDALLTPVTSLNRVRMESTHNIVQEEVKGFALQIGDQFRQIMAQVGSFVEVIYVYGGGANDVKNQLYPILIKQSKQLGGADMAFPILYLDSKYSRYLNREGLFSIAKKLAEAKAAGQAIN